MEALAAADRYSTKEAPEGKNSADFLPSWVLSPRVNMALPHLRTLEAGRVL